MTKRKKARGYQVGDYILVKWVDQNSYTEAHTAEGSINTCYGYDVGHFLEQNKDWLSLGMEKMIVDNAPVRYRHIVSLPKCAILEIFKLEVTRRKRND